MSDQNSSFDLVDHSLIDQDEDRASIDFPFQSPDELREARSRLESILTTGELGTWEFDVVNERVYGDRNLARIFGVTSGKIDGAPLDSYLNAIHPDDRERVVGEIKKELATGSTFESEYRILLKDGTVRWIVARGRIERDENNHPIRMPGVAVDISKQRSAESEVTRLHAESDLQRRMYDTVLSNSPDFNYTFDLQGRFTYINKALLNLWQKTLDEAVGKNFFELQYPEELAARLQRQIQEVIETRAPVRDETAYTAAIGERQYEYIFVPVFGESGVVEAVAGSTRDITEQKQTEEALREVAARLSEADHRKDEFLATLAHELRNPLAPIRNSLQIMKLAKNDPMVLQDSRELIERQLTHMVRLVDDLLDVSRITRGKIDLRLARVDLAAIIKQAIETSRPMLDSSYQELIIDLPPTPVYVNGDAIRLAQVFSNLLNNSCKYSEPGNTIWLSLKVQNSIASVSVRDSGIGIREDMLPRIFEMFVQIDHAITRSEGGLGVGLTLVKRLVELHQGAIEVSSAGIGNGSEFVVTLPCLANDAPVRRAQDFSESAPTASGLRILIVDDNRDSAMSLAMLLKIAGNETATAFDGLAAIELAETFLPDVVVLDIGLPRLSGHEVAKKLREQPWGAKIKLVAMTGWGQDEDRRKSTEAGFDFHLVKPVDYRALMKLLSEM